MKATKGNNMTELMPQQTLEAKIKYKVKNKSDYLYAFVKDTLTKAIEDALERASESYSPVNILFIPLVTDDLGARVTTNNKKHYEDTIKKLTNEMNKAGYEWTLEEEQIKSLHKPIRFRIRLLK